MKPLALAAALAVALIVADAAAGAPPAWDEVEPAKPARATCTFAELETLELLPRLRDVRVVDGWIDLAAWDRAKAAACRLVPARFAWTNQSFPRSTRFLDRLYPGLGHGSWADTCASSEGGHGPWVPNRGGSGAGGWLQFMSGTFWSVIDGGIARARARGVRIPSYARSWYSPLGQAIAGSEMLFDGRRGEWSGSTC